MGIVNEKCLLTYIQTNACAQVSVISRAISYANIRGIKAPYKKNNLGVWIIFAG